MCSRACDAVLAVLAVPTGEVLHVGEVKVLWRCAHFYPLLALSLPGPEHDNYRLQLCLVPCLDALRKWVEGVALHVGPAAPAELVGVEGLRKCIGEGGEVSAWVRVT